MNLKCNLEKMIIERGLKKSYVAKKAEISVSTMSLILKGKSIPTLQVAIRIAEVMGEKVEDIWVKQQDME